MYLARLMAGVKQQYERSMNSSTFLYLAGLVVVVAVIWLKKPKQKPTRDSYSAVNAPEDQYNKAIIRSAERLVDLVNESLKIAHESQNAETKISRLDFAKAKLEELKRIEHEHSSITITQLPQVEASIAELESKFTRAHYREAADGNMHGQALEKEGKVDDAILEYERLLSEGVDTPFTYRRLAIIYSKKKQRNEELRVLKAAIENIPVSNSAHYKWFAERLAKKS